MRTTDYRNGLYQTYFQGWKDHPLPRTCVMKTFISTKVCRIKFVLTKCYMLCCHCK
nr:unnamed protein product [Callosobruchus analis]